MTASQAIEYIESFSWSETKLGLDRTRELLDKLGNPQKKLRFVHVAGSNGKGSTCAMMQAVLRAAGYKTGLYTSPYIEDFCERMRVNGQNISPEALAELTLRIKTLADCMPDHPSQFELVTALAMEYFYEAGCDIVVLEVGMGGELDSTNVIDPPEAAVITNIGLEHTEYLGDTIEKIAAAKAGIIKRGSAVICYDGDPKATEVIRKTAVRVGAELKMSDFSLLLPISEALDGRRFSYRGSEYELSLLGSHQLFNAAVVIETVGALRERGYDIPDSALKTGLKTAEWPARLEVLRKNPLFILDGGHNPQCAEALECSLKKLLPGEKFVFLVGVLADKDWRSMTEIMLPVADSFICTAPKSPRALPAAELSEFLNSKGAETICEPDPVRALEIPIIGSMPTVCYGSLYLAGQVRSALKCKLK